MNNKGFVSGEATVSKGWLWRLLLAKCILPVRGKQHPRSLVSHKGRLYITVLREVILPTGITNLGRQCSISNLAWQWLVKMIGWSNDRDVPMLVFRFSVWVGFLDLWLCVEMRKSFSYERTHNAIYSLCGCVTMWKCYLLPSLVLSPSPPPLVENRLPSFLSRTRTVFL